MNKFKVQMIRLSEVMPYIAMFTFSAFVYWEWYDINANLKICKELD